MRIQTKISGSVPIHVGLLKFNRRTGDYEYLLLIDDESVLAITEDNRKFIYRDIRFRLLSYNLKTGDLKHYESSKDETNDLKRNELANDWVNYIYCDSEGLIWLGHYKGVSCFNPSTESFIKL